MLVVAALYVVMTTCSQADDYFKLDKPTYVTTSEQDCEAFIKAAHESGGVAATQMLTSGRVVTLPAGAEVIVKNVGANGVDTIRVKGYPLDLYAPSLLGFTPR